MRLRTLLYKRFLLVFGLMLAPLFWLLFRMLPFKKVVQWVARWPKLTLVGSLHRMELRWITQQLTPAKYWPFANPCVIRSLLMLWMHPRKHYPTLSVHKGVAWQEEGWHFHMWLEENATVISDSRPQPGFKKLASVYL